MKSVGMADHKSVGIVLVTVSVVAWRLTSQDAPSCRSMLGLGGGDDSTNEPNQRFVPRMPPSYGRPHHPYAASKMAGPEWPEAQFGMLLAYAARNEYVKLLTQPQLHYYRTIVVPRFKCSVENHGLPKVVQLKP
ncbi:hypothetical protein RUM43_004946 [Polyplax serrata]|uniref:Uncharacterized protein n=1 Tax=Polyplax serrata TaxID=468196 RepID=A0AAN8SE95_POLSC